MFVLCLGRRLWWGNRTSCFWSAAICRAAAVLLRWLSVLSKLPKGSATELGTATVSESLERRLARLIDLPPTWLCTKHVSYHRKHKRRLARLMDLPPTWLCARCKSQVSTSCEHSGNVVNVSSLKSLEQRHCSLCRRVMFIDLPCTWLSTRRMS